MNGSKEVVLYIHGKGGSAAEAERLRGNCGGREIVGINLAANTPWEARPQIQSAFRELREKSNKVILVANSIGAFFSMFALQGCPLEKALLISPILDMEGLICQMMDRTNVTEAVLQSKGEIPTDFGETLSWEYLSFVRENPVAWAVPTEILYGENDNMTSRKTAEAFEAVHHAKLTVMPGGEHWFHTPEQMAFLDRWMQQAMTVTVEVKTERLRIAPLEMEEMRQMMQKETNEEMRQAYGEMIEAMERSPGQKEWGAYWQIRLAEGTAIGGLCFMGPPDENGSVEIGYGIDEPYRHCGYAAEAVQALTEWALNRPAVREVTAQTEPDNATSQNVLRRCGFVHCGDGSEGWRWRKERDR